nr:peroxiredoxin [Beijerinckia indica]
MLLGSQAPLFVARTTMGERALAHYRGRWLVLFSHPADFTPVCTSEFIAFAKAYQRFQALDCDLLGLSVDSLFSHIAWVRSIKQRFGVEIPFPVIEDPSMAIASAYGMIHADAADSSTVRASFIIDPDGVIRLILWYPMSIGRSVEEILRVVEALQVSDSAAVSTPEGWHPGDPVIETPPLDVEAIGADNAALDHERDQELGTDWYYRLRKL